MTSAEDLIAWLRAQLDDDEQLARAAAAQIRANPVTTEGQYVARHIARWDTTRVWDEVEAKRQVVNECAYALGRSAPRSTLNDFAWTVLRSLTPPYVGRPGWREEWHA